MPFYVINGTRMHIRFSGKAPAPCMARVGLEGQQRHCQDISGYACDWPLPSGGTCDMPLCEAHAHQVGRNRHYCPQHRAEQLERQPELGLFTSLIQEDTAP